MWDPALWDLPCVASVTGHRVAKARPRRRACGRLPALRGRVIRPCGAAPRLVDPSTCQWMSGRLPPRGAREHSAWQRARVRGGWSFLRSWARPGGRGCRRRWSPSSPSGASAPRSGACIALSQCGQGNARSAPTAPGSSVPTVHEQGGHTPETGPPQCVGRAAPRRTPCPCCQHPASPRGPGMHGEAGSSQRPRLRAAQPAVTTVPAACCWCRRPLRPSEEPSALCKSFVYFGS